MKTKNIVYLLAAAAAFSAASANAASVISPADYTGSVGVGGTITIDKTITLDSSGASKLDVYFLADNTGSMGGIISNVASQAASILSILQSTYSDINFGVGNYKGDPGEGTGEHYTLQQAITSSAAAATAAIGAWTASGGGDYAEGGFNALSQIASNAGTGWRTGSEKLIVYFGDAPSHTYTTTEAQAITALTTAHILAMPMNTYAAGTALDGCSPDSPAACNQASAVATATGGFATNNTTSLTAAQLASSIISTIGTLSSYVDLNFAASYAGTGLSIGFTCTDALGCTHVAGGESRTFQMSITGNTAGVYDFTTYATGVAATETDHITVGVPEPMTLILLGLGLVGFGYSRRSVISGPKGLSA